MGCSCSQNIRHSQVPKKVSTSAEISLNSLSKISKGDRNYRFRQISLLGCGTYSKVYLCSQIGTEQKFALKVIKKKGLLYDMLSDELMVKEAEVLMALDHPNIIKCFEVIESESSITLVEEYVDGGSLMNFMMKMHFKVGEKVVAKVVRQILSALIYMHDRNIVHRDIKLENIFVSSSSDIKLGDFGIATIKDPAKPLTDLRGSLMHMAPEIFKKNYDEKVDIWSVGIFSFILLTGAVPYRVSNKSNLFETVKNRPFTLTSSEAKALPRSTFDFLDSLLKHDPKQRLSARAALAHPWLQQYTNPRLEIHSSIFSKLANISKKNTLQKILSLYICSFSLNSKDFRKISKYFKKIDNDMNGTIEKKEFVEELKLVLEESKAQEIADEFFENFDLNCNGVIDYMEFVTAICEQKKVFSDGNIGKVFRGVGNGKLLVTGEDIQVWAGMELGEEIELLNDQKIKDKCTVFLNNK